jgi:hypothetical protein
VLAIDFLKPEIGISGHGFPDRVRRLRGHRTRRHDSASEIGQSKAKKVQVHHPASNTVLIARNGTLTNSSEEAK